MLPVVGVGELNGLLRFAVLEQFHGDGLRAVGVARVFPDLLHVECLGLDFRHHAVALRLDVHHALVCAVFHMHVRQCHEHRRALALKCFLDEAVRGHEEHAVAHVGEADVAIRVGHGAGRRLGAIDLDVSCERVRHITERLRVGVEHVPIHRILLGVGEVTDWLVATFIRPLRHVVDVEDHALERRLVVRVRDVDGALTTAGDNA